MKRTTITDIAKYLKTTAATVSRALSDHPEINSDTKKRVREAALKLDYRPNKMASSLRLGHTKIIGVLIPSAEHPFFGSVIHGISNIASKNGYDVLIFQSNELQSVEEQGIKTFISAGVDGILVSLAKNTTTFQHFEEVKSRHIPIGFFDRTNDNIGIPSVCADDYRGAYMATESLIKEGYKKIAHISGPLHMQIFKDRLRGYQDALKDHKMEIHDEWFYEGDIALEAGAIGFRQFWALDNKPDAIFAAEDFTALGVLKQLRELKISVPQEVGLFGFCNDRIGEFTTPSLSTVDQQTVVMGEEAFNLIFDLITKKDTNQTIYKKVITPSIIIRESSQKTNK